MMDSANLIAVNNGSYLLQIRQSNSSKFQAGKYPYLFPGCCALFGGGIEKGESAEDAFKREMNEELPGLILPTNLKKRTYYWKRDLNEVLNKANNLFNGNLYSFLGFDPESKIPQSALGNERGKEFTYREWLYTIKSDNFFIAELKKEALYGIRDMEGGGFLWAPYFHAKCTCMTPSDKLGLLDDICVRIENGEITPI